MYEKLLVAIDHSGAAKRVLAAARELATVSDGEVWVLHLREREMLPRGGRGDLAGLILGFTAHKVIHLIDWPVLIVR